MKLNILEENNDVFVKNACKIFYKSKKCKSCKKYKKLNNKLSKSKK